MAGEGPRSTHKTIGSPHFTFNLKPEWGGLLAVGDPLGSLEGEGGRVCREVRRRHAPAHLGLRTEPGGGLLGTLSLGLPRRQNKLDVDGF